MSNNKKSLQKTGGGSNETEALSQIEEAIIVAAGLEACVTGIHGLKGYGISSISSICDNNKTINVIENVSICNVSDLHSESPPINNMNQIEETIIQIEDANDVSFDVESVSSIVADIQASPKLRTKKKPKHEMFESQQKILQSIDLSLKKMVKLQENSLSFKKQKWEEQKRLQYETLALKKQKLEIDCYNNTE